ILGTGQYGSVRTCIHNSTGNHYAVKSIEKSKIGRLDHLRREVMMLIRMNHDNIMKMVDCFECEEYLYIVTEQYSGGELFDAIRNNTDKDGCFSEAKAARIIKSLLEAVAYLHENGVVHRDIKPENILFESKDEDSDVKLIDFGLSRRHRKGVDPLMCNPVGTSYYMSPELLKGRYDNGCDTWSVGVVTYILLCGYPPLNGSSDQDIQRAVLNSNHHFKGRGWHNKSPQAKDFINRLLHRDVTKRFSAKEALMHPWIVEHWMDKMNVVEGCW
ncbi:predicted protein, partial [Thalassiosira pseudonana CCMP1335]